MSSTRHPYVSSWSQNSRSWAAVTICFWPSSAAANLISSHESATTLSMAVLVSRLWEKSSSVGREGIRRLAVR